MPGEDPDLELVTALQAGDDRALDTLMERHKQRLFHFVYRHIPHEADAAELTQEAFVRAYFNIQRFRPSGLFSTWLHQIALNLCRDHVRSKGWKNRDRTDSFAPVSPGTLEKEISSPASTPAELMEQKEEMRSLELSLDQLPLELKGPLLLTAVDGYSHKEAGLLLGLSAKAVELKVHRARKSLAKIFESLRG